MSGIPRNQLEQRAKDLIEFHRQATEKNEWTFFVDEMYAADCVYICEYGGTMLVKAEGIDDIKATHYGEDMGHGWEGWSFPYKGVYVGSDNKIITHWMNRGPGRNSEGGFNETPGVSFITFNDQLKICHQHDLFDLAHQMKLCDILESQGLLSEQLKTNWVIPMKARLRDMLGV